MGLLGQKAVLFAIFKGISVPFSIMVVSVCIPSVVQKSSFFSTPSPEFTVCSLCDDGHSDQCEVLPYCSFDLRFSNNQ